MFQLCFQLAPAPGCKHTRVHSLVVQQDGRKTFTASCFGVLWRLSLKINGEKRDIV